LIFCAFPFSLFWTMFLWSFLSITQELLSKKIYLSFLFSQWFHFVFPLSIFSFFFLSTTQEHLSFYKQTKTGNCKTMMVLPRDFMKDSYSFSSKTCLVSFFSFLNWIQAWGTIWNLFFHGWICSSIIADWVKYFIEIIVEIKT
jgi:hypothetical protein